MSFRYDPRHRPAQPATPPPEAFTVHHARVAEGVSLAFVREGIGGAPLLLVAQYRAVGRGGI